MKDQQAVTTSLQVAENFEKRHDNILRDIENLKIKFAIPDANNFFIKSQYQHPQKKQHYREYLFTTKGLKLYIDNVRKTKALNSVIKLYNRMLELEGDNKKQPMLLIDRFEDSFFNRLEDTLDVIGIELCRQYPILGYRIDGYIEDLKIAIEYDEEQHKYTVEEDREREQEISKKKGCEFIRLDYKDTDATNIGKVIKKILEVKQHGLSNNK